MSTTGDRDIGGDRPCFITDTLYSGLKRDARMFKPSAQESDQLGQLR
jgi:hypothetical protein